MLKNAAGFTDRAWHTIVTLLKHVIEAFMKLFDSSYQQDKTYSGAIRKTFWNDSLNTLKITTNQIETPDHVPSCQPK